VRSGNAILAKRRGSGVVVYVKIPQTLVDTTTIFPYDANMVTIK